MDKAIIPLIVAAISAVTAIVTGVFLNPWIEKRFHSFKLSKSYEHEQRQKIKNALAKHKSALVFALEELNHRLWNYKDNHEESWLLVNGEYSKESKYYFQSSVYRLLKVYGLIDLIQSELVYLDSTISDGDDLAFLKYCELMKACLYDVKLFDEEVLKKYDKSKSTDHFFRNDLRTGAEKIIKDKQLMSFEVFKGKIGEFELFCRFFDGLDPAEKRYRWDRLQSVYLNSMLMLNCIGYDYQKTDPKKIYQTITEVRTPKILNGYAELVDRYKLSKHRDMKKILKQIKG